MAAEMKNLESKPRSLARPASFRSAEEAAQAPLREKAEPHRAPRAEGVSLRKALRANSWKRKNHFSDEEKKECMMTEARLTF